MATTNMVIHGSGSDTRATELAVGDGHRAARGGEPVAGDVPRLANVHPIYLVRQLYNFQTGANNSAGGPIATAGGLALDAVNKSQDLAFDVMAPDVDESEFGDTAQGAQPGDLWRLLLFDGVENIVSYGDLLIEG